MDDITCGRTTANTGSTSAVTVGGWCYANTLAKLPNGQRYKVCRVLNNWPDECGTWSNKETVFN